MGAVPARQAAARPIAPAVHRAVVRVQAAVPTAADPVAAVAAVEVSPEAVAVAAVQVAEAEVAVEA